MTIQSPSVRPTLRVLALAACLLPTAVGAQSVATYFNRNIPSECNLRIKAFAAAGHKIQCVAFPPAGGNRWTIVTDKTFYNRNVPTELHNKMLSYYKAGHKILCVAYPPAGGNRWTLITDKTFFNRGVPTELHSKMTAYRNAGHKLLWVAYPPAGGNRWSLITDKTFFNRGVPTALHSRMQAFHSAGHRNTCVAFPPAGGNRWSVMTNKGGFYNWGVPSECHRVMSAMLRVPGAPLRCVAFDPDKDGFTILSTASPRGLPVNISTSTETFSIDTFAARIRSKLAGKGQKYGFVIRYGGVSRSYQSGLKRTIYAPPAQDFTIYDRFNPASVGKTVAGLAVLRALQNRRVSINDYIYKYLPTFWYKPLSVRTITFKQLLNHTSGFRGAGFGYDYASLRRMVAAGIKPSNKTYDYENVNFALARIVCCYLDYYKEAGVTDHAAKTAAHFAAFVRKYVTDPCGAPSVVWKPDTVTPTLFFPNPAGSSRGTTYGDWSLKPGSAGCNISLAELSQMLHLMRNSTAIIGSQKRTEMDTYRLGWDGKVSVRHGSYLWKNGMFPGSRNGGAELWAYIMNFSSGIQVAAVLNGTTNFGGLIRDAYNESWSPKSITVTSLSTSIPNVTKGSLVARGANLHLTNRVYFGRHTITSQDSSDLTKPFFRILSSSYVQIHAPQNIVPGRYDVRLGSGASTSAPRSTIVTTPRTATLVLNNAPRAGLNYNAVVAKGTVNAPHCWLAISDSNRPSVFPNVFNFGLGNNFQSLFFWPLAGRFGSTTAATTFNLPSLTTLKGQSFYFQALYATQTLPLPVSNVERLTFK